MGAFEQVNGNTLRNMQDGLVVWRPDDKKTWRVYRATAEGYPADPVTPKKFKIGCAAVAFAEKLKVN